MELDALPFFELGNFYSAHMIEFNGWVRLALSTDGEGEDRVTEAVQAVLPRVEGIRGRAAFPLVQARNGSYYLHVAGNANHKGVDWVETEELLQEIAHRFPGAYGVVYLRDDEDRQETTMRLWFTWCAAAPWPVTPTRS